MAMRLRNIRGSVVAAVQMRSLDRRLGSEVQGGPFFGMHLVERASWNSHARRAYLIGSYEAELHSAIETLVAVGYDTVIDVGCAEGYYAVGLARRLPAARVIAFDVDPSARDICSANASINDVNVDVRGMCDHTALQAAISGRTLLVVDCEGCEKELLDNAAVPALVECDFIVEAHDFIDATIKTTLVERFSETHAIEVITARQRDPTDYPVLGSIRPRLKAEALAEWRPTDPYPMEWLTMVSRSRQASRAADG